MAVEAICDGCETREGIQRYTLSVSKTHIPRKEKPIYPLQVYGDVLCSTWL